MYCRLITIAGILLFLANPARADPIEGRWRTSGGNTAEIAPCGGDFCITLRTGPHANRKIGQLQVQPDQSYAGTITDPASEKTYRGKGRLNGASLTMSGCVLGGLICRNQTWTRM